MEDLEEVITYHREALTLRPPGHPDHSSSLDNMPVRTCVSSNVQFPLFLVHSTTID